MSKQHIHKLKKLRYKSGNHIFFCTLPDCNFKISTPLVLGKYSICWRCGESFIMNEYSLRLSKPHCDNCHKPRGLKNQEFIPLNTKDYQIQTTDYAELSLADRLEQTIHQAKQEEEEEI